MVLPARDDAPERHLRVHVHQNRHVRHREDAGYDAVGEGAQPSRQICHGHDVPHEDDVVVPPPAAGPHDDERTEDVQDVERRGAYQCGLALLLEIPQLHPADGGVPAGVRQHQHRATLRLQPGAQDVRCRALPGTVHPVHYVPDHGIRAPAQSSPSRPPGGSRCCRTGRGTRPPGGRQGRRPRPPRPISAERLRCPLPDRSPMPSASRRTP